MENSNGKYISVNQVLKSGGENMLVVFVVKSVSFRCICGLLRKKPRILVTHQIQYLKAADQIVVLKQVCVCLVFLRVYM